MKHYYCRSGEHELCRRKMLKDGIGPVEIVNCSCECHPPGIERMALGSPVRERHTESLGYINVVGTTNPAIKQMLEDAAVRKSAGLVHNPVGIGGYKRVV